MNKFKGFPPGKLHSINIHAQFITELVPMIDDLAELKICLFCYYALLQKEGDYRYLTRADFANSAELMRGLEAIDKNTDSVLDSALEKAVEHRFLLTEDVSLDKGSQELYFMNTAKGRTAIEQLAGGHWQIGDERNIEILPDRPNIFTLYEENIGALTPAIAERLKEAEQDYAYDWIVDAINIAIENNVRRWKYISTILERWKQEGRVDEQTKTTQRNSSTNGKYSGLNWSDFAE
jgi:DNA replication protein